MLCTYVKIIGDRQEKIYVYKNTQLKILEINADIWFNKNRGIWDII